MILNENDIYGYYPESEEDDYSNIVVDGEVVRDRKTLQPHPLEKDDGKRLRIGFESNNDNNDKKRKLILTFSVLNYYKNKYYDSIYFFL